VSEMILVENTSANVTGVSNLQIKNGYQPKNVILRPGVNQIDNELWESMKSISVIKSMLENGNLKVILDGDDAEKASESLNQLHYTQANKIIKATWDIDLLKKWQSNETRAAVLKTIETQIKQIETPVTNEKTEMFL